MSGAVADGAGDGGRARAAPLALRPFGEAGVLAAADVHVAIRLGALGGERDGAVLLAAALATRAPRLGHVLADLARVRETVTGEDAAADGADPRELPWPELEDWRARLGRSPLVAVGEEAQAVRPLRLVGTRLYLDRYWAEERRIAGDLRARERRDVGAVDDALLADGLRRLFDGPAPDLQRLAAAVAVRRGLTVVAGGPGTGKTTTVARILALVEEQAEAAGGRPPLVALAAPTGKAAARLQEAVSAEAGRLDVGPGPRARIAGARASTLHRLLGWRPGSHSRFRHGRGNRLPHDLVVVDETSMVSLTLMARLLEAVRDDARLVLMGDPRQLSSVEAGAVLGDIAGPAAEAPRMRAATRAALARVTGQEPPGAPVPPGRPFGEGVVTLTRVHRFGGAIADLAEAVRRGDADGVLAVLGRGAPEVAWLAGDAGAAAAGTTAPEALEAPAVEAGRRLVVAARAGRAAEALEALGSFRLLCAHRRGPHGVATWNALVEGWLVAEAGLDTSAEWYVGRPLLVTENDDALGLHNGDTGVVVAGDDGRVSAAFERAGAVARLGPTRLGPVATVHAMTVHKAQGSQFDRVAVVLPPAGSPLLTRELLYTAVTRARRGLVLAGGADAVRAAVARPVARASGLTERLWGPAPDGDGAA